MRMSRRVTTLCTSGICGGDYTMWYNGMVIVKRDIPQSSPVRSLVLSCPVLSVRRSSCLAVRLAVRAVRVVPNRADLADFQVIFSRTMM